MAGDTNGSIDVFRKDLVTGETIRLSETAVPRQGNEQGNSDSEYAAISLDGRYIVVESAASNLVTGDVNDSSDIFLTDTSLLPYGPAIVEGRFLQVGLGVGSSPTATIAWGDGSTNTVASVNGKASFAHAYDTAGVKAATVSVQDSELTWSVAYRVELASGTMTRDTTLLDTITGGAGNDSLVGDSGANVLIGKQGNDTYTVDNAGDVVSETSGNGSDTVLASVSYVLAAASDIEVLEARGASQLSLVGNAFANTLIGNGRGSLLSGGAGNDAYTLNAGYDKVAEAQGGGFDTIASSGDYILDVASEIEVLRATGMAGISLTGNAFTNMIVGNVAANRLAGGLGNDTIFGDAGNDRIYGGTGKDALSGGAGRDVFVFDTKANKKTNLDKVTDYVVKDDTIWIENKYFKVGKGTASKPLKLANKMLWVGSAAHDADDRVIYNKKTGVLSYDADGTGHTKQVEIAVLKKNLKMVHSEFFVI